MSTGAGDAVSEDTDLPEHRVTINQLVGYNMARYRREAGLTQVELGRLLGGWTKVAVSAAEHSWDGKRVRKFDADELVTIARALGVPVIALLLPPEDAGTAKRYVLDAPGLPDLTGLLRPYIVPAGRGDSPPVKAYLRRLFALGVSTEMPILTASSSVEEAGQALAHAGLAQRQDFATLDAARAEEIIARAEEILADARARAESLERDAQERHRQAVGSLVRQREELERRVDDLRAFERDYRSRLATYLEGQLRSLRAGAADSGAFPAVSGPMVDWRVLTRREREVLMRMTEGESSKQIAHSLGLSRSTVTAHVQNILTKLRVHSRLEAVTLARRSGLPAYPGTEPAPAPRSRGTGEGQAPVRAKVPPGGDRPAGGPCLQPHNRGRVPPRTAPSDHDRRRDHG